MASFHATFQSDSALSVTFASSDTNFAAEFGTAFDHDKYEGAYSVVPSAQEQVLHTKDFLMMDNVTIAPIPQNYGLITWNGIYLTIS